MKLRRPLLGATLLGTGLMLLSSLSSPAEMVVSTAEKSRMSQETKLALATYQSNHFTKKEISSFTGEQILKAFIEDLDYTRLFYTEADLKLINQRFAGPMHETYLAKGDLYPAFEVFETYKDRVLKRVAWIKKRLAQPLDLSSPGKFLIDRTEAKWPKDDAEADQLWTDRLIYDLVQETLNDQTQAQALEKLNRRYSRIDKFVRDFDARNVQEVFISAVGGLYDPHTNFLSTDTLEEFANQMQNSFVGIGASLRDEDGYCVVQELISGGPAEKSGLVRPGDTILAVAQEGEEPVDVVDLKLKNIVKIIRGKKGSEVTLTLAAAGDLATRRKVTLTRNDIPLTDNLAKADLYEVPGPDGRTRKIGLIRLPSFYGDGVGENANSNTSNDVEELIGKLKKLGAEGIVLDLSRNGGGLLNEAIKVSGLFIKTGPVVQVKDAAGNVRIDSDNSVKIAYDGPLAVLVSRYSASASEIVAGALKAHNRALIVGDPTTHGKGTVQTVRELNRGLGFIRPSPSEKMGAAKVTIQKFYLPKGDATQHKGVPSDVAIPSVNEHLKIGESDLPNALPWDTIDPVPFDFDKTDVAYAKWLVKPSLVGQLKERYQKRYEALPEFKLLAKNIEWFKKRKEEKEIPLALAERQKLRDEDKAFKKANDAERDRLALNNFPSTEVRLSISQAKEDEHQKQLREIRLPDGSSVVNRLSGKIFYYQPEPNAPISEVSVDKFDFEKLSSHLGDLNKAFSSAAGKETEAETLGRIFNGFKNGEKTADFQVTTAFNKAYAKTLTSEQIDKALPALLKAMIKLEPRVADAQADQEPSLRESLRLMTDWLDLADKKVAQVPAK